MHNTIEWFGDQFNVKFHAKEGAEEFMTVRGCRIVNGSKGEFVSWPATKSDKTGKWWNHVWGSDAFGKHVLDLAKKAKGAERSAPEPDDDLPF